MRGCLGQKLSQRPRHGRDTLALKQMNRCSQRAFVDAERNGLGKLRPRALAAVANGTAVGRFTYREAKIAPAQVFAANITEIFNGLPDKRLPAGATNRRCGKPKKWTRAKPAGGRKRGTTYCVQRTSQISRYRTPSRCLRGREQARVIRSQTRRLIAEDAPPRVRRFVCVALRFPRNLHAGKSGTAVG
jgi:hypothetical protein